MFGTNGLEKISLLTEDERFDYIKKEKVSEEVLIYLSSKFQNLTIVIPENHRGNIFDLMNRRLLEGWCWQTTETSIVFLKENDYIERGYLKLNQYEDYYHSWICFRYKNEEYVFDPCLGILCRKEVYSNIFETDIKGIAEAKKVREFLIDSIHKSKYMRWKNTGIYIERNMSKVRIVGNGDVTAPMYGNNTEYEAEIDNRKIKRLVAHYCKEDKNE